jgi:hypothetical protein
MAKTAAVSDDDGLVMERIVRLADTAIGPARGQIDFRGVPHVEGFVRTLVVELFQEGVELGLLQQQIRAGWPSVS